MQKSFREKKQVIYKEPRLSMTQASVQHWELEYNRVILPNVTFKLDLYLAKLLIRSGDRMTTFSNTQEFRNFAFYELFFRKSLEDEFQQNERVNKGKRRYGVQETKCPHRRSIQGNPQYHGAGKSQDGSCVAG